MRNRSFNLVLVFVLSAVMTAFQVWAMEAVVQTDKGGSVDFAVSRGLIEYQQQIEVVRSDIVSASATFAELKKKYEDLSAELVEIRKNCHCQP